ncbi:tryptophan halogenase family protein [Pseudocolwellia sp. AS88]|uniref:tryptophan halogenase family protein n=1 Tax=Pseudocolwellia sp. AS88 TaxID=3063958 RepID=UPI0026F07309|nr:tryptophan halogenase family protein [Pseudocolwellia sp. AS88]MDO7084481.1 tryptophan 7-halogenase [Pseudocolwellia sp. AS88]
MNQSSSNRIRKIVIAGGGTAGWMSAAALASMLSPDNVQIVLVESEEIGTVGVGEATIPDIISFNRMLGIDEAEFLKATNGTFKLGIEFSDWGKLGDKYFHPFGNHGADMNGIDFHQYWLHTRQAGNSNSLEEYSMCAVAAKNMKFALPNDNPRSLLSQIGYAYHFDATAYALFLRDYAEKRGVIRIEGRIEQIVQDEKTENISALVMQNNQRVEGDFFFDCTGFKAKLLGETLGVPFHDWSKWLPCNSAQAVASERRGELLPYTKSMAKSAGWQWRIPTQHRTGNGHIYCADFMDDQQAIDVLMQGLDAPALSDPRTIRFTTGCRDKFWHKNCMAIGLSSGFLEPLESTSIFLIQQGISRFIALYPSLTPAAKVVEEYNRLMTREFNQVRDFIILHYKATQRTDSEFWRYCKNMSIPDSLQHKMELFQCAGRVFRDDHELFSTSSWVAVMTGQNIYPETPEPMLLGVPIQNIEQSLQSMQRAMQQTSIQMPTHAEFIKNYAGSSI